jgi:glycosyltransferase involved in cell wall biosynthesis
VRLLIVTYHFPPDGEIGGVRPYRLAQFLPEFGIEPWILTVRKEFAETPDPGLGHPGVPPGRVVRAGVEWTPRDFALRGVRLIRSLFRTRQVDVRTVTWAGNHPPTARRLLSRAALGALSFPDSRFGWYRPAMLAGDRLLAKTSFDAVVSTSPPRTAHFVAAHLSHRHRLPWIMDFRDPWYTTSAGGYATSMSRLQRWMLKRTASRATALVANSPALLRDLHGFLRSVPLSETILNGFSPPAHVSDNGEEVFSIGYFGQMPRRRSAAAFLRGLNEWLRQKPEVVAPQVRVQFTGPGFPQEVTLVRELGLTSLVSFSSLVPRQVAFEQMSRQWLLLLLANDQPLQIPGKVYEYLATGRRILAVTESSGATAEFLAGIEGCSLAETPREVAAALDGAWQKFAQGQAGLVDRTQLLRAGSYENRGRALARLVERAHAAYHRRD